MTVRAEVLSIGDELIHGALLDTNSQWIAGELEAVGVAMQRFTVVSDEPADLRAAIAEACARADVVVATGGLGPTLDDRTRDVVADLLGGPLEFHEQSWREVQHLFVSRGRPVPESNRRQAMLPPGAVALPNGCGTAPGFRVRLQRADLFALPGVPREMREMLREQVLPWVAAMPGRTPIAKTWLRVLGPSEALLGERIGSFMVPGRNPAVGITASGGLLTVRIVGNAPTKTQADAAVENTAALLRPLLGDWLFAEGTVELPELIAGRFAAAGRTLAFAESCTGGLLASRIVDVPGISAVFRGGVVCYGNDSKQELLGVPAALLTQHGAVSEPVAAAMAEGARTRLAADVAAAVTGIAGPDGGTREKPVGMVCFAIAAAGTRAWTTRIPDLGRAFVRDRAVFEVWRALLQETAAW